MGLRGLPFSIEKAGEIIVYLAFWKFFSDIPLYSKTLKFSFESKNASFCARLILHTECHIPKVESWLQIFYLAASTRKIHFHLVQSPTLWYDWNFHHPQLGQIFLLDFAKGLAPI